MPFKREKTFIEGLDIICREPFTDNRGAFSRMFCVDEFRSMGILFSLVQVNHSVSFKSGTIRGLHLQLPPHSDGKLITCTSGEVFDVAVDLRRDSPTRFQWFSQVLSATNNAAMLIPRGFAHGFQALTDNCHLTYFHDAPFNPNASFELNAFDAELAITWPLPPSEMSDKDKHAPSLREFRNAGL